MSSFERLGVIAELIQATQKLDWLLPKPVQDEAIPLILGGGDVMVAAETGSGKTAAFALPILQIVYETLRGEGGTKSTKASNINQNDTVPSVKFSENARDKLFNPQGLKVSCFNAGWKGGRANVGVMKGKYYYEVSVIDGGCRVGWCTTAASYTCGQDGHGWGYGYTGKKAHNNSFEPYGIKFDSGDIIGCYLDMGSKQISYSVNGEFMGVAFEFGGQNAQKNIALYPCCTVKDGNLLFNFGSSAFGHLNPKKSGGFIGLQNAKIKNTSIYYKLMQEQNQSSNRNKNCAAPLAIILAPTRDLAQQIFDDTNLLKTYLTEPIINTALCIGGVNKMMSSIMKAHIVIGSIGSMKGLIQSNKMTLGQCKFFTLDEADRILDPKQGNSSDVMAMYSRLPSGVQVMLFSATLHSEAITKMSEKLCHHPTWVDLKGKDFVPDTVHHCILVVDPSNDDQWRNRDRNVVTDGVHQRDNVQYRSKGGNLSSETKSEAVKIMKPLIFKKIIDAFKMDQCLVFCRTRLDCDNLVSYLTAIGGGRAFRGATSSGKENPYSCTALHSGVPQYQRKENLQLFKNGDVRFLVCTDVAARGIDIKTLPYVINITMPAEDEDYIHRVGRVGRADHPGIAISIVSSVKEKVWYHANCSNRGKDCYNTDLVKDGGCCKWYDEVKIFELVEKRLGGTKIPILDQEKHLNSAKKIELFKHTIKQKEVLNVASEKKLEKLKPTVEQLNELEVTAQNQWLAIPYKFNNILSSGNNDFNMSDVPIKKKKHRGGKKKRKRWSGPARG